MSSPTKNPQEALTFIFEAEVINDLIGDYEQWRGLLYGPSIVEVTTTAGPTHSLRTAGAVTVVVRSRGQNRVGITVTVEAPTALKELFETVEKRRGSGSLDAVAVVKISRIINDSEVPVAVLHNVKDATLATLLGHDYTYVECDCSLVEVNRSLPDVRAAVSDLANRLADPVIDGFERGDVKRGEKNLSIRLSADLQPGAFEVDLELLEEGRVGPVVYEKLFDDEAYPTWVETTSERRALVEAAAEALQKTVGVRVTVRFF